MTNPTIDLTNCDAEPIHIPGQIQSHGFLIAIDHHCIIRYHSDNLGNYISAITAGMLGKHINEVEDVMGENNPQQFITALTTLGKNKGFDQTNPYLVNVDGKPFNLIISPSDEYYVLEFEPALSDLDIDIQRIIGRSVSEMLGGKDLHRLLDNTANQVKHIIGYDRVMIYRFADDGHGEVVAEARNEDLESWLGLHYPASDIPKQARELYKKNLTRLIANVHITPAKIRTTVENLKVPLNLTNSQLRAVSPIHIQYLKNMKVESSFSISLLYRGELWGLIACHNYSPRFIDYKSRESSKLIGQILSSALEFRQDEENQQVNQQLITAVDQLSNSLLRSGTIQEALIQQEVNLLSAVNATGALFIYENTTYKLGNVPDDNQLNDLMTWIKTDVTESFYHTHELPTVYPPAAAYKQIASGIMISVLSREIGEYVIWFKPEQSQVVNWAGNPEKPAEYSETGLMHISPRHSFETWTQTISGKSKIWTQSEIRSATRLREEIFYAITQKAALIRQMNETLKHAYEELDSFSFTIAHDLKNPLSTVKSYSQLLLRNMSLDPKVHQIIERIHNGASRMNVMINEVLEYSRLGRSDIDYVEIDVAPMINEQVKDLMVAYDVPHLIVNIGPTPPVYGDPLMVSQVFANLIGNAVKYSIPSGNPMVTIKGLENETGVVYSIADNGIGIDNQYLPKVFELFNRMDNARDIEGSGVGLAIVKRIMEKHKGTIRVESELGKGSTFYAEFINPKQ